MKKLFSMLLAAAILLTFTACGKDETDKNTDGEPVHVEMSVKDFGVIQLELYPDIAPITVENFVSLVKSGFYDGLTFHRIYKGFMIQGGDPKGNGTGNASTTIKGEFSANGVENALSHTRGVISMARGMNNDSASCQFFIVHEDSTFLDGQYAAFGKVTEGMDVVDAITDVEVEMNASMNEKSTPVNPVVIEYIKVVD